MTPLSQRVGKRVLSRPLMGRLASQLTMRQIKKYESRLPRLWNLYSKIPDDTRIAPSDSSGHQRFLDSYYSFLRQHVSTLPIQPTISIVVPVHKTDIEYLQQALASVAIQTYPHWQVCVVDDASGDPEITSVIDQFRGAFPDQVKAQRLDQNVGIAEASNAALELATGDYVGLLDHDDRLYPNALSEVVRFINLSAEDSGITPEILYSDERVIGSHGQTLSDPFYKPSWSPLLHLSVNYTTHFSVYARELLERIGGFRTGFDGSQDHDLMLRASEVASSIVHVPASLYQWRAHPRSTASTLASKPSASDAGVRAVTEACHRRGHPADVIFEPDTGHYRVDFHIPEPKPLVSIVIPTHDAPALLDRCLQSIRDRTTYPAYEIVLVDNRSTDPEALSLLARAAAGQGTTVVRDNGYFNFARLCNAGVAQARGQYIVLLNNDTEVITPRWLEALISIAQLPGVGAVGGQLLYPGGTIQHAGVLGIGDQIAGHSGRGRAPDDTMYRHIVSTVHEAIAVTGACLCIAKDIYTETGGLDEHWVPNAYGDVDLCLRLREQGLRNVYTPYAALTHHESPTRKRSVEDFERSYMRRRWPDALLNDPYLNPHLRRDEWYRTDHRFDSPEIPSTIFDNLLEQANVFGPDRAKG